MNNSIPTLNGMILVVSCDTQSANVGIVKGNYTCYRRLGVPEMAIVEQSSYFPWEMSDEEFLLIIEQYKKQLVALIANLNKGE